MEVWKMDEEKYVFIVLFVIVDLGVVKKININMVFVEILKIYFYIIWNVVNFIVKLCI